MCKQVQSPLFEIPNPKLSENLQFLLTPFMAKLDLNGYLCFYLCHCRNVKVFGYKVLSPTALGYYSMCAM